MPIRSMVFTVSSPFFTNNGEIFTVASVWSCTGIRLDFVILDFGVSGPCLPHGDLVALELSVFLFCL